MSTERISGGRVLCVNDPTQPQKVVYLRIEKSLYDKVVAKSARERTSINKLCVDWIEAAVKNSKPGNHSP